MSCDNCPDCSACCAQYIAAVSGASDSSLNAAGVEVQSSGCNWSYTGSAFLDTLECDPINNQWKFTRYRLPDEKKIVFTASFSGASCPEDATWSVDTNEIGGSPTVTILCADTPCSGDCSSCCNNLSVVVANTGTDSWGITGTYAFTRDADACTYTATGGTITCNDGVAKLSLVGCGTGCTYNFITPSDGGCIPLDATWYFKDKTDTGGCGGCDDPASSYTFDFSCSDSPDDPTCALCCDVYRFSLADRELDVDYKRNSEHGGSDPCQWDEIEPFGEGETEDQYGSIKKGSTTWNLIYTDDGDPGFTATAPLEGNPCPPTDAAQWTITSGTETITAITSLLCPEMMAKKPAADIVRSKHRFVLKEKPAQQNPSAARATKAKCGNCRRSR